jgi:hypothetical protein
MTLKVIKLELARTKEHPEGDPQHSYVFRAPLTADGHLDATKFKSVADLCSAVKSSPGEAVETGRLIHTRAGWAFSYAAGTDDDEPIFRLGAHVFRPGEYVTITEHDETQRPFRVVSVHDAPSPA